MSRISRRSAAITFAFLVIALGVLTWRFIAERLAVAALLRAGASVAFESDMREAEVSGSHWIHTTDDRNPFLDVLDSLSGKPTPKPGQRRARPSGCVKLVDLPNDEAVRVILRNRASFSGAQHVMMSGDVSDAAARRLFEAISGRDMEVESVTCHVTFDRQETLDVLLRLPLKGLLICRPVLPEARLDAISSNAVLEEMWMAGGCCESCQAADLFRYDADDIAAVAECSGLRVLYLCGLVVDDDIVKALSGAKQLETLYLSQCRVSQESADSLRAALPDVVISITEPSEEEPEPNNG